MQWHYAIDGEPQGPVSAKELAWMAQQGAITDDTLVWREGFVQWQRFADITGSLPLPEPRNEPDPTTATPGYDEEAGEREHESSSALPGPVPGPFGYGDFWPRFAARVIDTVILLAVIAVASRVLDLVITHSSGPSPDTDLLAAGTAEGQEVLSLVLIFTYEVFFVRLFEATPGKMALGLKILRADGTRLQSGRIFRRELARNLSGLILGIGYLMAAFDGERRALHDRLCDTRVIRTRYAHGKRP
jgi:uncharacterized RDD family membrane protein YckC